MSSYNRFSKSSRTTTNKGKYNENSKIHNSSKNNGYISQHDTYMNMMVHFPDNLQFTHLNSAKLLTNTSDKTASEPLGKTAIETASEPPNEKINNYEQKDTPHKQPHDLAAYINKILENHLWQHAELLTEFKHWSNKYITENNILDMTHDIYKMYNNKYKELLIQFNISKIEKLVADADGFNDRGIGRMKNIKKAILDQEYANAKGKPPGVKINPTCYLDIGCYDGNITKSVGAYFKLNKFQIHGVDIEKYENIDNKSLTFAEYDGIHLPYSNNSFDLITCMMVFHHISDDNLKAIMQEINRVMKHNGIVILREHSVQTPHETKMLNILHGFHDFVWNDRYVSKVGSDALCWNTNYKSAKDWTALFMDNGFVVHTSAKICEDFKYNPFMNYMCSFRKISEMEYIKDGTLIKIPNLTLFRNLHDGLKTEKYSRRTTDIKTVIHWGQRKLLLTEIEFITMFLTEQMHKIPKEKVITVVYAGAAPGNHILYLSKLFPFVKYVLYDPRPFSKNLKRNNMISTYEQYFTEETAHEWEAAKHPDKVILLISDIRTGEPESQTSDMVEERVLIDHEWQKNWYDIIQPELSMFKFRLPWVEGETNYLDGDIFIQPYPPLTSTETRLIIRKNAGMKNYNNKSYEERLYYFNKYMRHLPYKNILNDVDMNKKHGIRDDYDGSSEIFILEQYIKLKYKYAGNTNTKQYNSSVNSDKSANSANSDSIQQTYDTNYLKQDVIDMIGDLNKEIGVRRTLFDKQPLKEQAVNLMRKLKSAGFIPNIPFNRETYNIYVIPKYDYFISIGAIQPVSNN